jgi:hypothetical protein
MKNKILNPKNVLVVNAKCSDGFWGALEVDGVRVGEYHGYVPEMVNGHDDEDYVKLRIDIDTGQILNWKKPSKKELSAFK